MRGGAGTHAMNRYTTAAGVWCAVALTCLGCVTTTSSLAFRGAGAEGWVMSRPHDEWLSLQITNQGPAPIRLSYVGDEYEAKTRDGRTILLDKADFLNYPIAIPPGRQRSVTLSIPKDVSVHELARISATLNTGQTVVALEPIGTGVSVVPSAPAPLLPLEDPVVFPMLRRAGGPVPVVVEFQQAFGTTLKAEVQWDGAGEVLTLANGCRQTFYVVPGRHRLRVKSQLPLMATTEG